MKIRTNRSRNRITSSEKFHHSNSINNIIGEKVNKKNLLLTNLTEHAGEARNIIRNNNSLKQNISNFNKNNAYIKNFINKIITINKDINLKLNNNKIHLYKENFITLLKEYNDLTKKINIALKEKIEKEKQKNEKYKNDLEKEIEELNIMQEKSVNTKFILENKNKYKDNVIKVLKENSENIGCIQEILRYRFINDELSRQNIDKYYAKYLSSFQQTLLNASQSWNKYKNMAIKFEQEIDDLQNFLENPENIDYTKKKAQTNDEENISSTENDLFLLTFDEFEDDSRDESSDSEAIQTDINNKFEDNNIYLGSNTNIINNNQNLNYIKDNNYNKINPNIMYNKINPIKNMKNFRKMNKINSKKDIYYLPQKDFSRSLIKKSESVKKIMTKNNINIYSEFPKIARNVSINSISKLNLKQIVFNKNNKFMKEEAKEMAMKRYKIENEYEINIKNSENPNEFKIEMEIKELKKDIKIFKDKIIRKKKIIREFKFFCKDLLKKYDKYIKDNNLDNNWKYFIK